MKSIYPPSSAYVLVRYFYFYIFAHLVLFAARMLIIIELVAARGITTVQIRGAQMQFAEEQVPAIVKQSLWTSMGPSYFLFVC